MHVSKCGDMTKGMALHTLYNGCPSIYPKIAIVTLALQQ